MATKVKEIKATCIQMAHDGHVGHVGSALSCVEAVVALYSGWLNICPSTCCAPDRDIFILSKGHACTALYAVLAEGGFLSKSLLEEYAVTGSPLSDHPCKHALNILEFSTGSLGYGLGVASGMLYGRRLSGTPGKAAVLLSDGECNEGSVWEAAMFAAAQKLDTLVALVDNNGLQAVGKSADLMGGASIAAKFEAFGWAAKEVDGNDIGQVLDALNMVPFAPGKPSVIVLKTLKGAGVSFMEDEVVWHYRVPTKEDLSNALKELGVRPIHRRHGEAT